MFDLFSYSYDVNVASFTKWHILPDDVDDLVIKVAKVSAGKTYLLNKYQALGHNLMLQTDQYAM